MKLSLVFLFLFTIAKAASGSAATLVVPPGASEKFGDTYADPFFFAAPPAVVQVYGSSEFASASSDVITITAMSFRLDPADAGSLNVLVPRLVVFMASYSGPLSAITRFGLADLQYRVVMDKSVQFKAAPTTPNNFAITLSLDTPYIYDRRLGHLVVDFRPSGSPTGYSFQAIDAQTSQDSVLVRNESPGHTVLEEKAIVTKFSYTEVPEPSPLRVLCIGLTIASLGGFSRKG